MPASDTRPDEEIRSIAQEVAAKHLAPRAEEYDFTGEFPLDNIKRLGECGLMGLMVPPEYGGLGGSYSQYTEVSEILARACPSTAMIYVMHVCNYVPLVEQGTPEQKQAILPGIARGELIIASGTTEPGTGGNFFYCNSAARRVDGGWRLSAIKPVVTSAPYADYAFSITRVSPDARGNQLSLFMVPCKAPGVSQIGDWNTVGLRATCSSGLQFDNVALTDLHLLGGPGGFGEFVLTSYLPIGMCGYSAVWLGAAQAAFDFSVEHVQQRTHRFNMPGDEKGHNVASYESVQRQIAEAGILLYETRALLRELAREIDEAKPAPFLPFPRAKSIPIASKALAARVASGENALAVTTTALRVAGAQGYRRDYLRIERCHRDVLAAQVMAPSPDLTKPLVGKLFLGMSME